MRVQLASENSRAPGYSRREGSLPESSVLSLTTACTRMDHLLNDCHHNPTNGRGGVSRRR